MPICFLEAPTGIRYVPYIAREAAIELARLPSGG